MDKQSIPKLRFPEFEKVWKKMNIQKLCKKTISYGIVQTGENIEIGVPCVRVVDLTGEILDVESMIKTSDKISNSYKKTILEENEVMLALRGDIGLVKLVEKSLVGANLTRGVARLSADENLINPFFLNWVIQSNKVLKEINKQVNGSALKEIPLGGLRKVSIFLSDSLTEQQKIASFLTDVDDKITKLTKKKDLLEQYKKGIMQQLFNQELRFKDGEGNEFPEWEEKKLGEVCDVRDGTHDSPKYVKQGYPLITSKNLNSNGKLDIQDVSFINELDYININKRSKVDVGDIIFGMIGTIGNPVLLKEDGFAIKNVALIKEKNELLNIFLIHYLKSNLILKQFHIENSGGTQKFVALGVIRNLKILSPSIEEQTKIANFLSDVDTKIENVQSQIERSKTFKKGLLQQMFV